MSKCDVNMTEEAAFAEDASIASILTQIIHSGNFEQCACTLTMHGTAWCTPLKACTACLRHPLPNVYSDNASYLPQDAVIF